MSSDSCLVFYGVRYALADEEIPLLETRRDPRLRQARQAGLKHYWGAFAGAGQGYYLYVGHQVGLLGAENQLEVVTAFDELSTAVADTDRKLSDAGFAGAPRLYVHWLPD